MSLSEDIPAKVSQHKANKLKIYAHRTAGGLLMWQNHRCPGLTSVSAADQNVCLYLSNNSLRTRLDSSTCTNMLLVEVDAVAAPHHFTMLLWNTEGVCVALS